jgi:hypothetical protein
MQQNAEQPVMVTEANWANFPLSQMAKEAKGDMQQTQSSSGW